MDLSKILKINDSWLTTGIVWVGLIVVISVLISQRARLASFFAEVKGELVKASWPWESDPKIKGVKKYRQLINSTSIVLVAVVLLAGFVQLVDFLLVTTINFLHSL